MSAFYEAILPYYPSGTETSQDLLYDSVYLIGTTTINGVAYGIALCLYVLCAYFVVRNLMAIDKSPGLRPAPDRRKWFFYLAYSSVLSILATLYTASGSQIIVSIFVDNQPLFNDFNLMNESTFLLILWLTDALILWRFIMLSQALRRSKWIIVLPCAMYITIVVSSSFAILPYIGSAFAELVLILSFSLNILTTLLISTYLYIHKRNFERVLGKTSGTFYTGILMMLIESAALNGIWSLTFLILFACHNVGLVIMFVSIPYVQIIAQLLIILAIARGTAWENRTQEALSTIHFEQRERRVDGPVADETRGNDESA